MAEKIKGNASELRAIRAIEQKVDRLANKLEVSGIEDYFEYRRSPKKMMFSNFVAGLSRGFGMAIGFTILGAIVIYIIQRAALESLPLIGDFIADIVQIVKEKM